jgi:RNA polymerase sigma-70 factor (ECF subfamily)
MTMAGPAMRQEIDPALVARLHARAKADRWSIAPERFGDVLARAVAKRFDTVQAQAEAATEGGVGVGPSAQVLVAFLEALHLEDLALAIGCADGDEMAWDTFVSRYRADLARAAASIAGPAQGRDLADSLFAELFGVDARGARRRPLFDYFHGRSRLSTWLHALLSQRHVDALRAGRRTSSLDEMERPEEMVRVSAEPPDPDRARLVTALQHAFDAALASIDANDRLRLACYHVDGMTLAEIARLFREHEATASRKLTRIRQALRQRIDEQLAHAHGFAPAQVRQCYEYALEDGGVRLTGQKLVAGNSVEVKDSG